MKLLRYLWNGAPTLGALQGSEIVRISDVAPQFREMRQIAACDPEGLRFLASKVEVAERHLALADAELLAPIERPGKYLGIGLNYGQHAKKISRPGLAQQARQIWFNKQSSCLSGPYDAIVTGVSEKLDYEVELGVVIGKTAKMVSYESAWEHVFGYLVVNDVTARDWLFHSPTLTLGKSFDTYGPIGPWIITTDEIDDPHVLGMRCHVNGEIRQNGNTGQMISNIWAQINYLSTAFTLETGDLLATGTPDGVGATMEPPRFLVRGDVVRCEIDRIGAIENEVM